MNTVESGLGTGGVVDITTIGARTGAKRRIEINYVQLDGRFYITGRPGRKRDWQANLKTNPEFTVHLKDQTSVDVLATARLISDATERSDVLYRILTEAWDNHPDKATHILPKWVNESPLVEFAVV